MRSATARRFAIASFSSLLLAGGMAHAAGSSLDALATCRDSWLEWKDDPARSAKFAQDFRADYTDGGGFLLPKTPKSLLGMSVSRVYPESAGMAVGFSVLVNSGFEAARKTVEKALGKPLKCDDKGDEVFGCELSLGPKKTAFVMTEDKSSKSTLVGCFYFYEK